MKEVGFYHSLTSIFCDTSDKNVSHFRDVERQARTLIHKLTLGLCIVYAETRMLMFIPTFINLIFVFLIFKQ